MMHRLALLLVFILCLGLVSCASPGPDTSAEDELINMDESADSADSSADESAGGDESQVAENQDTQEADDLEQELNQAEPEEAAPAPAEEQELKAGDEMQEEPPPPEIAETPEPAPAPAPEPVSEPAPSLAEITNIKYLANQNGGTVVIETSGPVSYQVRNKADTGQFVVEINGATLPNKLKRPFILKEFDAAFAAINAYQNPGSTTARIVIQQKNQNVAEPVVQQEGNSLVVIPSTPSVVISKSEKKEEDKSSQVYDTQAAEADEKALGAKSLDEFLTGSGRFYGRKISIEVNDQDIREVLNFIATEVGVNVILSEEVKGRISMKLREIPWDQALVTIMKAKKLGYVRQGNVVRIATLQALQEESDSAKKILDSQRTLSPLRVKVIPVSYAAVEELAKQVPPFLTHQRGQIVVDARTSSLIITDTEDILERIGRLVKQLDIPPAQVMIEGKVVEASDNFGQTLGLNWSLSGNPITIGKGSGANGTDVRLSQGLAITNLPPKATGAAASPFAMSLRIGRLDLIGDINAALNLAEQESQLKILSSPRVVTMNKEKANISQKGETITVQSLRDSTGQTSRNIVRTGYSLDLSVLPQITAEGSVIMDVEVKREFPGAVEDIESGARPINSRSAKTKILVNDGQTAVIGGIYSSDQTTQENGVPWLRHIPVLGWLFKSRVRTENRNELLIFLTPKVLNIKDQAVEG